MTATFFAKIKTFLKTKSEFVSYADETKLKLPQQLSIRYICSRSLAVYLMSSLYLGYD